MKIRTSTLAYIALFFIVLVVGVANAAAAKPGENPNHDKPHQVTLREYNKVKFKMTDKRIARIFDTNGRIIDRVDLATYVECPKNTDTFCGWHYDEDGNLITEVEGMKVWQGRGITRSYRNVCGRPVTVEFVKINSRWISMGADTYFPYNCDGNY